MKLIQCGLLMVGMLMANGLQAGVPKALPNDPACSQADRVFMERAYELAREGLKKGNPPFGAVLVLDGKIIGEASNITEATHDPTRHAELVLISKMTPKLSHADLGRCVLYTSSEPCTMCCGAILAGGVAKVVYGVTEAQFQKIIRDQSSKHSLNSREIMARSGNRVTVLGPLMEQEGLAIHEAYWPAAMKKWTAKQ